MTRKEIIDGLQFTIDMFLFDPSTGRTKSDCELNSEDRATVDACRGAIELLSAVNSENMSDKGSYLPLTTQVNVLSDDIKKTGQRLNKQLYFSKKNLVNRIRAESLNLEKYAEHLDKYRNVLIPLEACDSNNSIFEELVKIKWDIETAQNMLAHHKYKEADELLQNIKKRI